MTDRLSPPGRVLLVADANETTADIEAAVVDGVAGSVDLVATTSSAATALEPESDVGCVVAMATVDADVESVCRACREANRDVPIVAVLSEFDASDVEAITTYGDVRVVRGSSPEDVAGRVADALDTYERRVRLREDATMFRSFLSDIGVSMYAKDCEGRHVRMANVPGGRDPQDVLGKRDTEIYPDSEGAEQSLADDRRVVEEEATIYGREEHFETDAGPQWLRTNKVPWRDERGQVRGSVGLTWDITDEMLNQRRLTEREEALETFARSLSHDVRTPLQVARGNVELLRDEVDDEEPADRADAALERITEMLEDLEVVAKDEGVETGVADAEPADDTGSAEETESDDDQGPNVVGKPTPIRMVADRVWSIIETRDATLDIEFGTGAVVFADEANLRPLLENLFTNAIRHGGDDVSVRLGHLETGGFFVEDDGPGIPPEQRQKVLTEGFTTVEEGTGTGFSIVTGIVNRRAWDLDIEEGEEGGARIEIHNCMLVADPPTDPDGGERVGLGQSDDVGAVSVDGSADYDGQHNRWVIEGAGRNVWQQVNEFQFLHVPVDGPVSIVGRIPDFDPKSQYSKAGFMVRDDLDEDAAYGYVGTAAGEGTEALWRNRRGEDGVSQQLDGVAGSDLWYRVDRRGDSVTTSISEDGEEWTPLDQRLVETTDPVEVGLVVCSHMPQTLVTATFADVTVCKLPEE